ncbi:hypothetical protein CVT24_009477, partial [Panaeolus cyanescens]
ISTYSKAAYVEPNASPLEADASISERDLIGLIRGIAVKVRSSAKRKERFKSLQIGRVDIPKTLILDMKVRWSSTLAMLLRAIELMLFIKDFIYELSRDEPDLTKRPKIDGLLPTKTEWSLIETLVKLLKQAFSYENTPCLHTAIPALERLYHAWSSRASKDTYAPFAAALAAGADKINEYYVKTATSHAYTFSLSHYWNQFKDRYDEISGSSKTSSAPLRKKPRYTSNSDDSDDDETTKNTHASRQYGSEKEPWLREFERYIDGEDEIEEDQDIVQWWGINARRFPTWASLAFDYLAIMGSSVSSERAFSAAGITISKRRNRLKGDIVEALQFLKSLYATDLIFREPPTTASMEDEFDVVDDDDDPTWEDEPAPKPWSTILDIDDSDVE